MPSFIRINGLVISVLTDHVFQLLFEKFEEHSLNKKVYKSKPISVFFKYILEYSLDLAYSGGTKQKLDIATIFKNHPQDLKLLINFLNEIALSIKEEISEPESYALNGTIEKIQKYYESICMPE